MDRQERGDAWVPGRQSLEDQRGVEAGHAAAAVLFANIDRGHAQRRRLAQDVCGKMLGLVPAKRVGRQALVGEGFRHVADGDMVCMSRRTCVSRLRSRAPLAQCPTFAAAAIGATSGLAQATEY